MIAHDIRIIKENNYVPCVRDTFFYSYKSEVFVLISVKNYFLKLKNRGERNKVLPF